MLQNRFLALSRSGTVKQFAKYITGMFSCRAVYEYKPYRVIIINSKTKDECKFQYRLDDLDNGDSIVGHDDGLTIMIIIC